MNTFSLEGQGKTEGSGQENRGLNKIGEQIRSLEFLIEGRVQKEGEKTNWLDSFRNLFIPISLAIDLANIDQNSSTLPEDKVVQIINLKDRILSDAEIDRDDESAQLALRPLVAQLEELISNE